MSRVMVGVTSLLLEWRSQYVLLIIPSRHDRIGGSFLIYNS